MKRTSLWKQWQLGAALLCSLSGAVYAQTPDPTFGSAGFVITPTASEIQEIATQPDGKIVAAGYTISDMTYQVELARYMPDGSLDATFGAGGLVTTTLGFSSIPGALVIQPDGKILLGCTYSTGDFSPFSHIALVRYNANGSLDASFGESGIVMTIVSYSEALGGLKLLADGRILAGGEVYDGETNKFLLLKYNSNGSLDPAFGSGGIVVHSVGAFAGITDMEVLPNGSILATGTEGFPDFSPSGADSQKIALVKYNSNGAADPAFGTNGVVITDLEPNAADIGARLVVQADGRIIVGGTSAIRQALVRFMPNGAIDASFGTNGRALTEGSPEPGAMLLQPDGKILTTGSVALGYYSADFLTMRYKSDGTPDETFGDNGTMITTIAPPDAPDGSTDYAHCMALQADGKLLVAGSSNGRFALVRYNTDITTGIDKKGVAPMEVALYPNPAHDHISLRCAQAFPAAKLRLTDAAGRIVWHTALDLRQGDNTLSLPATATGLFVLSLEGKDGSQASFRFIRR